MDQENCIFCKIISGKIPSTQVYSDKHCVAFKDINPQSKTHLLIIPRKHIDSVLTLNEGDEELMGQLIKASKSIAEEKEIEGYKLQINVGEKGGQEVFHIHVHLLAN
jgi:histidine triad (HIT) family protein